MVEKTKFNVPSPISVVKNAGAMVGALLYQKKEAPVIQLDPTKKIGTGTAPLGKKKTSRKKYTEILIPQNAELHVIAQLWLLKTFGNNRLNGIANAKVVVKKDRGLMNGNNVAEFIRKGKILLGADLRSDLASHYGTQICETAKSSECHLWSLARHLGCDESDRALHELIRIVHANETAGISSDPMSLADYLAARRSFNKDAAIDDIIDLLDWLYDKECQVWKAFPAYLEATAASNSVVIDQTGSYCCIESADPGMPGLCIGKLKMQFAILFTSEERVVKKIRETHHRIEIYLNQRVLTEKQMDLIVESIRSAEMYAQELKSLDGKFDLNAKGLPRQFPYWRYEPGLLSATEERNSCLDPNFLMQFIASMISNISTTVAIAGEATHLVPRAETRSLEPRM